MNKGMLLVVCVCVVGGGDYLLGQATACTPILVRGRVYADE